MATIVLTAVGGLLGPVGAAIGAAVGQQIDRQLFGPKGREGPRLTDLSVQVSSYGAAIPRVYGTMRVAGSVIWSTDLIETRSTSHHKGQPSATSYSYAASFAVLLSARPVAGIGRIWADGNLLRGAAGDFKARTGFRLHSGSEDQPPDPLIASLEGAVPAHRGCAYAVFEQLDLTDFGNRIPSLTFELIADADSPAAGTIAADVAGGVVVDDGVAATVAGFSAYGASARATLDLLATAGGARFMPRAGGLAMTDATAATATLADQGYATARERSGAGRRSITAIEAVPRTLAIAYYDVARDYQIGVQQARRPGAGTRDERFEMPAAMSAAAAKTLAEARLARAETARDRRLLTLPADAASIPPGAIVAIDGESGRWRATGVALEEMVARLTLERVAADAPVAAATPGRALPAPDRVPGTTLLVAAELPPLTDDLLAAPRISLIAAGTGEGWRSAALLYSLDGGASWRDAGSTALPGIVGTLVAPPRVAGSALADLAGTMDVELARADMMLADADDAAIDGGANLALAGDELIQFGRAEPLGGRCWRLSRLWRGRRGTEAAAGQQVGGDRFALVAPGTAATIDLPVAALGSTVRLLASGIGDVDGPVAAEAAVTGASMRPPSPVHPRIAADGTLGWTRRSRAGFRWIDGGDAPLAEEAESWRVTITPSAGATREVVTATAMVVLTVPEHAPGTAIEIRQRGTLSESPPAHLTI